MASNIPANHTDVDNVLGILNRITDKALPKHRWEVFGVPNLPLSERRANFRLVDKNSGYQSTGSDELSREDFRKLANAFVSNGYRVHGIEPKEASDYELYHNPHTLGQDSSPVGRSRPRFDYIDLDYLREREQAIKKAVEKEFGVGKRKLSDVFSPRAIGDSFSLLMKDLAAAGNNFVRRFNP